MISFDNTENAFAGKSDGALKKAHFLFSMIGRNWVVSMGKPLTNLAFTLHLPVKGIIRNTIFRQFVGGESIEKCEATIAYLHQYHIGTILDYSVEGQEDEASFEAATEELLHTVAKAKEDARIPFAVFKVSGIARSAILEKVSAGKNLSDAETGEWQRVTARVHELCRRAHEAQTPILVDAEESWIQQAIDDLALEMMRRYNREKPIVYNTTQMYRHDRLAYIRSLFATAEQENFHIGLKIVRGAYMEKERDRAAEKGYPDPIQPDKQSTDRDFNKALRFCTEHVGRIAICAGTHNEESSRMLVDLISEHQIGKQHPHIYFAQLLGMSDHISFNLSQAGYNVAKYVPYGPVKEVMPYLIRRAEENTSVKGQTGRELSLIKKELIRRRRKG